MPIKLGRKRQRFKKNYLDYDETKACLEPHLVMLLNIKASSPQI